MARMYNLPKESKLCPTCSTAFYPSRNDYMANWKKRRFCSAKCAQLDTACKRTFLKEKPCKQCGTPFKPRASRNKYCSQLCYWESKKGMEAPNVSPDSRVTLSCRHCQKFFIVTRHEATVRRRAFCSRTCYYEFVKAEHPNGLLAYNESNEFYLSKEWGRLKRMVKKRDGYICQACHQQFARTSNGMRVHHVIERTSFVDVTNKLHPVADSPDNLVTLCISCHNKTHTGTPLRS